MKLLIVGSRNITNVDLEKYVPKGASIIISGGAKGVDTLAESYADKKGLSKLIMRPKYNLYGKGAPLKRNLEMVEIADQILVFWDGKSKGTKFTIDTAKKLDKSLTVIIIE